MQLNISERSQMLLGIQIIPYKTILCAAMKFNSGAQLVTQIHRFIRFQNKETTRIGWREYRVENYIYKVDSEEC